MGGGGGGGGVGGGGLPPSTRKKRKRERKIDRGCGGRGVCYFCTAVQVISNPLVNN